MPAGVSPFVSHLWEVVEDASISHIVSWDPDNDSSFIIHDYEAFRSQVLPRLAKSTSMCAIIRQLSNYGFNKISRTDGAFSHRDGLFERGHPEKLPAITRRRAIPKSMGAPRAKASRKADNEGSGDDEVSDADEPAGRRLAVAPQPRRSDAAQPARPRPLSTEDAGVAARRSGATSATSSTAEPDYRHLFSMLPIEPPEAPPRSVGSTGTADSPTPSGAASDAGSELSTAAAPPAQAKKCPFGLAARAANVAAAAAATAVAEADRLRLLAMAAVATLQEILTVAATPDGLWDAEATPGVVRYSVRSFLARHAAALLADAERGGDTAKEATTPPPAASAASGGSSIGGSTIAQERQQFDTLTAALTDLNLSISMSLPLFHPCPGDGEAPDSGDDAAAACGGGGSHSAWAAGGVWAPATGGAAASAPQTAAAAAGNLRAQFAVPFSGCGERGPAVPTTAAAGSAALATGSATAEQQAEAVDMCAEATARLAQLCVNADPATVAAAAAVVASHAEARQLGLDSCQIAKATGCPQKLSAHMLPPVPAGTAAAGNFFMRTSPPQSRPASMSSSSAVSASTSSSVVSVCGRSTSAENVASVTTQQKQQSGVLPIDDFLLPPATPSGSGSLGDAFEPYLDGLQGDGGGGASGVGPALLPLAGNDGMEASVFSQHWPPSLLSAAAEKGGATRTTAPPQAMPLLHSVGSFPLHESSMLLDAVAGVV